MKITVKAKVTDDSKNKLGKIGSEFQNYQVYLQSGCTAIVNLYSATKQQAQRALKKIKQLNPKKQYPVILRLILIVLNQDNVVLDRYHRLRASKELGIRLLFNQRFHWQASTKFTITDGRPVADKRWNNNNNE